MTSVAGDQSLMFDADRCTGCRICELICSMTCHGEYNPRRSHIRLLRNREMDVGMVALDPGCNFCGSCAEWCPHQALEFVSLQQAAILRRQGRIGKLPAVSIAGAGRHER